MAFFVIKRPYLVDLKRSLNETKHYLNVNECARQFVNAHPIIHSFSMNFHKIILKKYPILIQIVKVPKNRTRLLTKMIMNNQRRKPKPR